jgi:ubiquinone/menaquinone biosynthesis C-methylase UbiE
MKELCIITPLHKKTKRDYLARMVDDKPFCMGKAKEYERDYWDGDRRFGYGGYGFRPGYWKPVAEALVKEYNLTNESKVLDVGCGKAFLLWELHQLLPEAALYGFDISQHGLASVQPEIKPMVWSARAENVPYTNNANADVAYKLIAIIQEASVFPDKYFDLVFSNTTLHNLKIFDLEKAVKEISRIAKRAFICVESFRNDEELFNVECWALTCQAFFSPEEWVYLYKKFGGENIDYEFIYFEGKSEVKYVPEPKYSFNQDELFEIAKRFDNLAENNSVGFAQHLTALEKFKTNEEVSDYIDKLIERAISANDSYRLISAKARQLRGDSE